MLIKSQSAIIRLNAVNQPTDKYSTKNSTNKTALVLFPTGHRTPCEQTRQRFACRWRKGYVILPKQNKPDAMDDKVTFSEKFKQRLPLLSAVALVVAVLLAVVIIVCLLRLAFF